MKEHTWPANPEDGASVAAFSAISAATDRTTNVNTTAFAIALGRAAIVHRT